jgi:hypothetical protein
MNYDMQGMTKYLLELFAMFKTAEVEIKKEHNVLLVNKTMDFKKSGKSMKGPKGKKPQRDGKRIAGPPKVPKMKPEVKCFYCKGDGHWKCNYPKYLEDKKASKVVARDKSIFDIHVTDIYLTSARSNTWVFDTSSVANICNSQQNLRNKRRLERNEVTMQVGNGQRVDIVAIGTLHLRLPSGMILVLNKCYYLPALSMNIVSGSRYRETDTISSLEQTVVPFLNMVFSMFMRMFVMVYIFWILIVMLHASIVWMPRDVNLVMIIPRTRGIVVLFMLT